MNFAPLKNLKQLIMSKINKKKKKNILIIGIIIFAILAGFIYFMNMNKLENYDKLSEKLPEKQMTVRAQITKINKMGSVKIRNKSYGSGYLYTYVFTAKRKKYMGNDFLKVNKYEINDSIDIIYLPENPSVSEFKK
jgi:hypothetical protein